MTLLQSLQTAVPSTVLAQDDVRDIFAAQPHLTRLAQRLIGTAFNASGIEKRYTVIDEFTPERLSEEAVFFDASRREVRNPGTRARNEVYASAASHLAIDVARRAVDDAKGIDITDITHVVTVSCTGFYSPGLDFDVVRTLGLNPGVQRYHLGFMGCYAAIPALRAATQFCAADEDAIVLVVCVELCTLHLRSSSDPDTIVASSLFADGAAAGIVSNRPLAAGQIAFSLDAFEAAITPEGSEAMAWTIGDHGFEMVLSSYVPHIIGEHVEEALGRLYQRDDRLRRGIAENEAGRLVPHWAIHPGGREILDRVQRRLTLSDAQLVPSRMILRDYGNMSSVTVLFVLKQLMDSVAVGDGERVVAMAFGPGLTLESALLTVQRS